MPELEAKFYGFRKGRYAVDKLGRSSNRHKYHIVVNIDTDTQIGPPFHNDWDGACRKCTELDRLDPVKEPAKIHIHEDKRATDGSLPPVRVKSGQGDPF